VQSMRAFDGKDRNVERKLRCEGTDGASAAELDTRAL
jgi:hypothetical protein